MILAALALAAQPAPTLPPQAVTDAFVSICFRALARPEAVRRAIRRSPLGFARGADENGFEIYRSPAAKVSFRPGEGCELEAVLTTRAQGARVIADVSAAAGQAVPPGSVNHPGTASRYYWPRPAEAGNAGLAALLEHGRHYGSEAERPPVRLSLWAYLASEQE